MWLIKVLVGRVYYRVWSGIRMKSIYHPGILRNIVVNIVLYIYYHCYPIGLHSPLQQNKSWYSTVALEVARPNIVRHAILRLNNVATVRFRDRSLIPFRDQTNIHFRYRTSTRTSIDLFLGSNNGLFLGSNSGPFLRPTSQTYYGIYM